MKNTSCAGASSSPVTTRNSAEHRDHDLREDRQRDLDAPRQPPHQEADDDVLLRLVDVGDAEESRRSASRAGRFPAPTRSIRRRGSDRATWIIVKNDDEYERRHRDPKLDKADRRQDLAECSACRPRSGRSTRAI